MSYQFTNQQRISHFFYVFYKRKYYLLAFFVIIYLGIVAGTWLAPQSYRATTEILVHTNTKQEIALFHDLAKPGERDFKVNLGQDMVQILSGEEMAHEIVTLFKLDELYYQTNYEPETLRDTVWYYIHVVLDVIELPYTYSKKLLVILGWMEPEPEENYFHSAMQEFLDDWLDIQAVHESKVVSLSIWGPDPELSSAIANKMGELLIDKTLDVTRHQALAGYEFVHQQFSDVEKNYLDIQNDLRMFMEEYNVASLEEQKKSLVNRLNQFETKRLEIESELHGVSKAIEEIRKKLNREEKKILLSEVSGNNPFMLSLKSELKDYEIALGSMLLEKTEKHPDVVKLKAKIVDIQKQLKREVENIVASETDSINPVHQNMRQKLIDLESQQIYLAAKNESLESTIAGLEGALAVVPQRETELKKLQTSSEIYTQLYSTMKDKLEKLSILKESQINEFGLSVISRSNLPAVMPVTWPWWDINTLYIGLPLSFVFAFFASYFIEYWTDTFSTRKELEFVLGVPVIGLIPNIRKKGMMHKTDTSPEQVKMLGEPSKNRLLPFIKERRKLGRVTVHDAMIVFDTAGKVQRNKLWDLNLKGASFESSSPLAVNKNIRSNIFFDIDGTTIQLEVPGRVVWSHTLEKGHEGHERFAVGLQFQGLKDIAKEKLEKLIDNKV